MTGASPVGCRTRQTETLKRAGQRHFKGDGGQESAIAGFTTLPAPAPWWALFPWLADVGVGCLPGDPLRAAMMVARQSEAVPRLGVAGAQGPPGTERVAAGRERHVQRDDVLGRRDALGLADSGRTGHRPGTAAFQWTVTPFSVTSTPRSAAAQLWVRVGTTALLSFDPARLVLSWVC
jgi:hypothetical protein